MKTFCANLRRESQHDEKLDACLGCRGYESGGLKSETKTKDFNRIILYRPCTDNDMVNESRLLQFLDNWSTYGGCKGLPVSQLDKSANHLNTVGG